MCSIPASMVHLPCGAWSTVLDCLCARFPHVDRDRWLARMRRGQVHDAQGRPLAEDAPYQPGLCVHYFREVDDEPAIPLTETLVYRDAHLVVADKPPFLPVQPAGRFVRDTLLGRLQRRLDCPDLVPLHRIDRATSGLVLFSPDPGTRATYQALFRERRIEKRYEALAPPLPQRAFPLTRRTRIVRGEPFFRMCETDGPANSETRIDVLDRGREWWRYALFPVTGRKHQLRVHMAALGAPIRHDRWYPQPTPEAPDDLSRPLGLLARELIFVDPLDGQVRHFVSQRQDAFD
ncbi:MAG TPA: pseudouridine synthase [Rhodanobacteraceae bacterium]